MQSNDKQSAHQSLNTRIIPATSWIKHHEWPPIGGLRSLIFNRHKNGFDKVIKKIGRRVLIDEQAFFTWIAKQNEEAK
ncbi:MAG: hypothetical protein ACD_44C00097G0002 [uncultured bacterium]|nr:MAG: hypothetical protein ACD_44C00097G0002 [uncultured bacterium]OGT16875.1 MAG: hypothetical protein A3B69_01180 [Gammaproteobacteria bacterium RIFCSPHIGHO2_02_FULL_38_33]OGT24830.1 MAG: hypothetical protein A2W47_07610 [Gammaproteobacteria bacterium RIFCSPHIGHO2_12_38_15]OGT68603.1 MAG: hypothetical protein A3I12_00410 [Gammaproteobacteria bacterium RIFCSPLOWO2_02_FULL_38_11]OGT75389.1 MAG: hypothetical protein A3G71_02970 [Gammaproteobacteria bacterium RIFCSPLOWO2_12_FULL_38_14]